MSPLTALAGALIVGGVVGVLRSRGGDEPTTPACDAALADCSPVVSPSTWSDEPRPPLTAAQACRNVGYLCAELRGVDRIQIHHWKDFSGTIVVHVPRPPFEQLADATRLQQAAALGLRAWNGQPFEIMTDLAGNRNPHFSVTWVRGLEATQIGVARTQWSVVTGLRVVSIELTTRNPYDPSRLIDAQQVRLTAAHEMGHALGLPHSDSPTDVMYPSNTATSLSSQDYRTMESLYRLPDGTDIVP